MARKAINDLLPGTDYVIQARAVQDGVAGVWSRKFHVTTILDTMTPETPANVTWEFNGENFHAEWDKVTLNTDGSHPKIIRYDMEVSAGGVTKRLTLTPTSDTRLRWDLIPQRTKALFGSMQTTVTFRVRSVNWSNNESLWSPTLTATMAAPSAPTGAVVEELMEAVKVSWTPPVNMTNVLGYRVYVGTTAGFAPSEANRIYDGAAPTTTYNTSTFSLHYFKIRAYSIYGLESSDLLAQGTPLSPFSADTTAPDVPTALSAILNRTGNIAAAQLSWAFNPAGANADIHAFAIRWRKSGQTDSDWRVEFADKSARAMSIDLPQAFANYEFQIASVDATANYSAWSVSATLNGSIAGSPPQVTGVTSTSSLDGIQLKWNASTALDVVSGGYYHVQIATDSGFTTGLLEYDTGNTYLDINGLSADTTYYFRVKAVDVEGLSGTYSVVGNNTTTGFEVPAQTDGNPPASSPAATAAAGIGYIFVNWSPVANADLVKYEVHLSTVAGFVPTLGDAATKVAETPGTVVTLSKTAAGDILSYAATYYVRIIAKDADTTTANAPAAGTVSAGVSPRKATTSDITTINVDQLNAGNFSAGAIVMASGGAIQSTNYVAGTTGYKISDTVVDIRSGTVGFGTLVAGTVTTTGLVIGTGGQLMIDATGAIVSNNYSANTTGWKISSTGIEMNDANSKIKAAAIIGDTVAGRDITVTSGGSIHSSDWNGSTVGWQLSYNGLRLNNGTIYGSSVTTNSLTSISNDPTTGLPLFSINAGGYATLAGARILGNTILGSSSSSAHYLRSYNYSAGSVGWSIDATGAIDMNNGTFRGTLSAGPSATRVEIYSTGSIGTIAFYGASTVKGTINYDSVQDSLTLDPGGSSGGIWLTGSKFTMTADNFYIGSSAGSADFRLRNTDLWQLFGTSGEKLNVNFGGSPVLMEARTGAGALKEMQVKGSRVTLSAGTSNWELSEGANFGIKMQHAVSDVGLVFKSGALVVGVAAWNAATLGGGTEQDVYANKYWGNVTTIGAISDRKFKENIEELTDASSIIKKIDIRSFNMKNDGSFRYGVIAQELQEVIPHAVEYNEMYDGLTVNYEPLYHLNIAATREVIERNEALEDKVARLEARLANLEQRA